MIEQDEEAEFQTWRRDFRQACLTLFAPFIGWVGVTVLVIYPGYELFTVLFNVVVIVIVGFFLYRSSAILDPEVEADEERLPETIGESTSDFGQYVFVVAYLAMVSVGVFHADWLGLVFTHVVVLILLTLFIRFRSKVPETK